MTLRALWCRLLPHRYARQPDAPGGALVLVCRRCGHTRYL